MFEFEELAEIINKILASEMHLFNGNSAREKMAGIIERLLK